MNVRPYDRRWSRFHRWNWHFKNILGALLVLALLAKWGWLIGVLLRHHVTW
jgi:hypothetical protein